MKFVFALLLLSATLCAATAETKPQVAPPTAQPTPAAVVFHTFDFSSPRVIAGIVLTFLAACLAGMAGGGGGLLLTSIYLSLLRFPFDQAIPLSNASSFASMAIVFALNLFERNPKDAAKPLTNYRMGAYIVAMMVSGSLVGGSIAPLMNKHVVWCWMLLCMCYFSYLLLRKAWAYQKRESAELAAERLGREQGAGPELVTHTGVAAPALTAILRPQLRFISLNVVSFALALTVSLLRGGRSGKSVIGIALWSPASWVILLIGEVLILATGISALYLRAALPAQPTAAGAVTTIAEKSSVVAATTMESTALDAFSVAKQSLLIFCVGVNSGLIGAGGTTLVSSLLLGMGYAPIEVAAMTTNMITLTMLSSTVQYRVAGALNMRVLPLLFGLSLTGSACGRLLYARVMRRYKRQGAMLWVLAGLISTSSLLTLASKAAQLARNESVRNFFRNLSQK